MERRNTMTVHLPPDLYFRANVTDGRIQVERITFGTHAPDPDMEQIERRVTVSGTVIRSDTYGVGVNQRSGTISVATIPANVATHILSTLM